MKTKILFTVLVMFIFAACNKDKYQTKPQLKFKKTNTSTVISRQILVMTLEATDAEGDLQDSLYIQKTVARCPGSNITLKYKLPNFTGTKNLKADIDITFAYNNNDPINNGKPYPQLPAPQCTFNDTAVFRFWLKDNAKNVSDTITSSPIVIVR